MTKTRTVYKEEPGGLRKKGNTEIYCVNTIVLCEPRKEKYLLMSSLINLHFTV
jgi:hypothetical protein